MAPLLALLLCILTAAAAGQQQASARDAGSRLSDAILRRYFSNEELAAYLDEYASRCSAISRKFSMGKSAGGADIWVLEISEHPGQREAKPNFKFLGNMHGDEPSGRQLLPMLAEWLCTNNGKDEQASRIIKDMHLFIIPTLNPDGFALRRRENKNNVDLNRNFPDPILLIGQDLTVPTGKEQPEVLALMNFTLSTRFVASANLHEGAVVANYPFDGYPDGSTAVRNTPNPSPDDAAFVHLAKTYAKHHTWMSTSKEFEQGITNGARWYPLYGGSQDWNYIAAGCFEVTLELTDQKWRPADDLGTMWEENVRALAALPLMAALGGVRGTVAAGDAGGRPLAATIRIKGIDHNITASQTHGYFSRPLAPGEYTLIASHEGFQAAEAAVVVPPSGQGAVVSLKLTPSPAPAAGGATSTIGSNTSAGSGLLVHLKHSNSAATNRSFTGAYIIAVHIGILAAFAALYMCQLTRGARHSDSRRFTPVQV